MIMQMFRYLPSCQNVELPSWHCSKILIIFNNQGSRLRRFPLDIGTINGVSGDKKYDDLFYSFVSFLTPGTIYRVDVTKVGNFIQ